MDATDLNADVPGVGDDRWEGADLCIVCLAELEDGCGQCGRCAAPVGGTAAISPWERILAEGFIYRRAVAEPGGLIVALGASVVFVTLALTGVWFIYWHHFMMDIEAYYLLLAYFNLVVGISGLWQCLRNYRRRQVG